MTEAPSHRTRHVGEEVVIDAIHYDFEVAGFESTSEVLLIVTFGVVPGKATDESAASWRHDYFVPTRRWHPASHHSTAAHIYYSYYYN